MELFERVKYIAKKTRGSETKFAEELGLVQRTFNGYLTPKRQDHLWALLPQILQCFPQVRREWLYFEEGTAFEHGQEPVKKSAPSGAFLAERLAKMEAELLEERRLNRQLTAKLLHMPCSGSGESES